MKYCQGPVCHTYTTKDRLKGPAGSKTYQTRRRSSFYYGKGNFCSLNCQNDWWELHGDNAVDHFGRLTEPIKINIAMVFSVTSIFSNVLFKKIIIK